ncbi:hypothetical protein NUW54_g3981 [Trametes sanguinea]|uniref:Uncharacterized protein n=1 Tax=Trametes sanguinea TaxID=158606 RepID=A0ACC1Q0C0_9APHY|nr:hypothetical protein NUW54_g3981 [Trametes sanguinea]
MRKHNGHAKVYVVFERLLACSPQLEEFSLMVLHKRWSPDWQIGNPPQRWFAALPGVHPPPSPAASNATNNSSLHTQDAPISRTHTDDAFIVSALRASVASPASLLTRYPPRLYMLEHVPFAVQAPSGGSRTDAANRPPRRRTSQNLLLPSRKPAYSRNASVSPLISITPRYHADTRQPLESDLRPGDDRAHRFASELYCVVRCLAVALLLLLDTCLGSFTKPSMFLLNERPASYQVSIIPSYHPNIRQPLEHDLRLWRNNVVAFSSLPRYGLDFSIACAHTVVPRLGEPQKMFIAIRRLFRKDKADARSHAAPSLASISTTSTATPSGNEKDTDGPTKTPHPKPVARAFDLAINVPSSAVQYFNQSFNTHTNAWEYKNASPFTAAQLNNLSPTSGVSSKTEAHYFSVIRTLPQQTNGGQATVTVSICINNAALLGACREAIAQHQGGSIVALDSSTVGHHLVWVDPKTIIALFPILHANGQYHTFDDADLPMKRRRTPRPRPSYRTSRTVAQMSRCPISRCCVHVESAEGLVAAFGIERWDGGEERTSGNASRNRLFWRFQEWLRAAYKRFSASVVVTDPVVISSESMKESKPVNLWNAVRSRSVNRLRQSYLLRAETYIVATLHAGFH